MNAARSRAATRVLITGFGPFPGVPVNASMPLLAELAARAPRLFPGVHLTAAVIATEWLAAPQRLERLLAESRPDVALHFGVSPRARGFELELRARNACCAVPDASGALPLGDKCDADCAEHLPVSLPVRYIVQRLRRLGIPAFLSRDAGAYLCNAALYHSLRLARAAPGRRVGFIHIPAALARPGGPWPLTRPVGPWPLARPGGPWPLARPVGRWRPDACPLGWDAAVLGALEILASCLARPTRNWLAASPLAGLPPGSGLGRPVAASARAGPISDPPPRW
jgi:pyroglutamyl-peptidase